MNEMDGKPRADREMRRQQQQQQHERQQAQAQEQKQTPEERLEQMPFLEVEVEVTGEKRYGEELQEEGK